MKSVDVVERRAYREDLAPIEFGRRSQWSSSALAARKLHRQWRRTGVSVAGELEGTPGAAEKRPMSFDYSLAFDKIDFRKRRELYRIGKGEQGVLLVEPYKSEILPHWRFKTPAEAKKSSAKIYKLFLAYLKADDFPGADMARKFLQMGWTRARRYANHRGGRKYDKKTGQELPRTEDKEKAAAAAIFYEQYVRARSNREYVRQKDRHHNRYDKSRE